MLKSILFFLCMTMMMTATAHADFSNVESALQKLKSYKSTFFADVHEQEMLEQQLGEKGKGPSAADKKVVDLYSDISAAVGTEMQQKQWSTELLAEIFRLTCLSLSNDNNWMIARDLVPLYQKDKSAFMQQLKKLPTKDAKNLQEAVENANREQQEGNG
jgi:ribosomal 50S subunit-associated protein YjgA (DUF615 family)